MSSIQPESNNPEIFKGRICSAANPIVYSDHIRLPYASTWNTQFKWTETLATFGAEATLWATNEQNPSVDNTDWVQMEAAHNFTGLPKGVLATTGKDMADISAAGAVRYRWMVTWASGSAILYAKPNQKALSR